MADHRDYADDERQPSLFDVLAPPSARPRPEGSERQPEGGRVVEFPRRREVPADAAESEGAGLRPSAPDASVGAARSDGEVDAAATVAAASVEPTRFLESAPVEAPEDAWLTEIAPDSDEAELATLAPGAAPLETDFTPVEGLAGEPRTQRAAGMPLSGPTLDDVMSRVWEGLVMRLPAACPVCEGELLPAAPGALGGSCTSCGTTIE